MLPPLSNGYPSARNPFKRYSVNIYTFGSGPAHRLQQQIACIVDFLGRRELFVVEDNGIAGNAKKVVSVVKNPANIKMMLIRQIGSFLNPFKEL